MMHVRRVLTVAILFFFLGTNVLAATSVPTETCYYIPTQDSLVRILIGAQKSGDGLVVTNLTAGERWVLGTFFSLETSILTGEEASRCGEIALQNI